jgi:hypothetical protein
MTTPFYAGQKLRASDLNVPGCIVTRSTAQTGIVNLTPTAITFDTEVFDNLAMFTASSDTITIKRAGEYLVSGYCAIESNATGYRRLLIEQNGGGNYVVIDQRTAVSGDATHMTIQATLKCALNDTLKLFVDQSSGGSRSTAGTPRFAVTYQSA